MGWLLVLSIPGYIVVWVTIARMFYGIMRAGEIDRYARKSNYTLEQAIDAFDKSMISTSAIAIAAFWPITFPGYGMSKLVQASPRLSNAEKAASIEHLEISIQKLEQENRRLGGN